MPEIRFSTPQILDQKVSDIAEELGVDKSDYIKNLILKNLRNGEHHARD